MSNRLSAFREIGHVELTGWTAPSHRVSAWRRLAAATSGWLAGLATTDLAVPARLRGDVGLAAGAPAMAPVLGVELRRLGF